jgi:hypothetical protein
MAEVTIPFDPKNFTGGPITNQFMPLTVGNTWFYEVFDKSTGAVTEQDTVKVTDQTITIDGVQCVVVSDVVENVNKAGMVTKVTETTNDYFAQDKKGDVWYFGEDTTAFLQPGGPSTEGTWRAGTITSSGDIAQPGIIMLAHPKVGDSYFEEQAPPVAVDRAAVTSLTASATVPFRVFTGDLLQTTNTSATPGDVESKFYAPGIGSILEVDAETSQELVSFNGQTSGLPNLVQAMASFGGQQSSVASGHATPHSEDSSLHHVLAAHSHHA